MFEKDNDNELWVLYVVILYFQGLLAEIITTFFLVHTVLLTAIDDTKWHAALSIGLTVTVDILSM